MANMLLIFLIATASVSVSIAGYAFIRREEPSAVPFALLMLACGIHALGYGFELISLQANTVAFWVSIQYVGISFFPFLLVWMTTAQKTKEHYLNTMILIVFFAVSLATFFLVQTNNWHHLYYASSHIVRDEFSRFYFDKGPWYYIHSLMNLLAFVHFGIHHYQLFKESTNLYRQRVFNGIIAMIIPSIAGVIYLLNLTPKNLDLLPFVYGPIGFIWLSGFLKYGIFDMLPVTYKKVFENISEGVVVLDQHHQVIHFNMAAFQIFRHRSKLAKGTDFSEIIKALDFVDSEDYPGQVFELNDKKSRKTYHLKRTDLFDKKHQTVGKILVVNDITKESEANRVLTTLATQDALTGIHNRRYFFDLCEDQIKRARVEGKRISFVLMDIDHFKRVNDTYGHHVGDQVLRAVTELCSKSLRGTDLIGRYGGEEFAILIYDAGVQVTHNIIERMRKTIAAHDFKVDEDIRIRLTVSFGVYRPELLNEHEINSIFKKADKGLYKAKSDGRDRVVFYSEHVN